MATVSNRQPCAPKPTTGTNTLTHIVNYNNLNNKSKVKSIFFTTTLAISIALISLVISSSVLTESKEYKKEHPQKGNLCIARFESATGEPTYYTCPRANESELKNYCCYLDKCCDYKEFRKQTEQQFKLSQNSFGSMAKGAIGSTLKFLLWAVFLIIVIIVGCCCLTFFLCRKKKLFQGGIFTAPLPAQPPGPSPYAPPTNPYMAYQWPPETAPGGGAHAVPPPPPAYPSPAYPPYPSAGPMVAGAAQPPYNPNFK